MTSTAKNNPARMAALAVALSAQTDMLTPHQVEDMRTKAEELLPPGDPLRAAILSFATMHEVATSPWGTGDDTAPPDVKELGHQLQSAIDALDASQPGDNHNRLTPAQTERLAMLAEECGEVIQIVGKILRHGLHSAHPDTHASNKALLTLEMTDLMAVMAMVESHGESYAIETPAIATATARKLSYSHHQGA